MAKSTAIETVQDPQPLARAEDLGLSIEHLISRVKKIRAVRDEVMTDGIHYGNIPGVKKPTLLKPGAETLCLTFQLAPKFRIEERRDGEHLECVVTCTLVHVASGAELGEGIGSCSTRESKYGWRKGERTCPKCGQAQIIKGKEQYGGGWLCWKKNGGCGAKFSDGDQAIEGQVVGRVPNPDIADTYNTVRKMACKRAHVAATLFVTGASELFTQDVEDSPHVEPDRDRDSSPDAAPATETKPKAKPQAVPSDADLQGVVRLIEEAASLEELDSIRTLHKNKRWAPGQVSALNKANQKRRAELAQPAPTYGEDERAAIQEGA